MFDYTFGKLHDGPTPTVDRPYGVRRTLIKSDFPRDNAPIACAQQWREKMSERRAQNDDKYPHLWSVNSSRTPANGNNDSRRESLQLFDSPCRLTQRIQIVHYRPCYNVCI